MQRLLAERKPHVLWRPIPRTSTPPAAGCSRSGLQRPGRRATPLVAGSAPPQLASLVRRTRRRYDATPDFGRLAMTTIACGPSTTTGASSSRSSSGRRPPRPPRARLRLRHGKAEQGLAESEASKVWGVDPEPEMLRVAEQNVPPSVGLKAGSAEQLPFEMPGSSGRSCGSSVTSSTARPPLPSCGGYSPRRPAVRRDLRSRALRRVLAQPLLPVDRRIDRARFPDGGQLEVQLATAVSGMRLLRPRNEASISREEALGRIEQRHLDVRSPGRGRRDARHRPRRRRASATIEYGIEWLIAVAAPDRRPRLRTLAAVA